MRNRWAYKIVVCGIFLFFVGTSIIPSISADTRKNDGYQINEHQFVPLSTNDWWPMFRHDVTHSGFSTTTGPNNNDVLWSYQTNYIISSSPAVSHGRVYVGSWDWNIYCLDMDSGNLLWNFSTDNPITSSPSVVNGKVYVGSQDGKLYCLDAINGTFLWDFHTNFIVETSPMVVDDKVFFGSNDGSLYCLNAEDGSLLWSYQTESSIVSSPAVTDGLVYFGVTNGDFLCLESLTGNLIWKFTMTSGIYSSPAVDNGKVYFGSNDKNVYCLDANDGSLIWNYSALSEVHSSPAIAYDSVYIGTSEGVLLCLQEETGDFVWSYLINGGIESQPSVADGKVYFGTNPCCGFLSYCFCLDAFNGIKIWEYNFNTMLGMKSSPALAASKAFVSSGDGKVYAFGDIEFLADANGPYYGAMNVPVHFTGSVYGGQPGYTWHWDFGDNTSSTEQNPTHTYASLGEYMVTLTVTDNTGEIATDETSVFIELPNTPPEKPVVDGPTTGKPGKSYEYTVFSSDPNNDTVRYYIDWGDNTTSGWVGPFLSGTVVKQNHTWSEKGSYVIRAKVKDTHGAQSNWSSPFVMIIRAPQLVIELKGGVGITATIRNIGDAFATNISWNIIVDGGFGGPRMKSGTITTIPAGELKQIRILMFGIGKRTITVSVLGDEGGGAEKAMNAFLFLFFVFGR
jgi:outer membrane protein assembly factor BamB